MRDVGWREEGTEQRFSCLLCHFLLGEADPWDLPAPPSSPSRPPPPRPLFSSKWPGYTHIHTCARTHTQMSHGTASVAGREDSVRINHACPSQGAIFADIMLGQPSGLEIVYVQYLRSTNVKFGCRFWSHWQRRKDGLQKCAKPASGAK